MNDFSQIISQGSWAAFIFSFVGGILASLTPCVYPMIPITIGFIASRAQSRLHAFKLSCVYVLGMCLMYSILGIFAAFTGKVFGTLTMTFSVYIFVGIFILLLGIVQTGWISIVLPSWISQRLQWEGQGAFAMGAVSGLVAAPCTVPILGVILTYIAANQNILFGIILMFSFSMGLGLLLLVLGTFTGFLTALPKSGQWLMILKKTGGMLLVLVGLYFIFFGIFKF